MNRVNVAVLSLLLLAGCGSESGEKGAPNDITFISGARLIAGDGSAPVEEATMIIENGVIKQVGKKGELFAPKGSAQPDMESRTLIPLLVNVSGFPGLNNAGTFGVKNYKRDSLTADLSRYGYYGIAAVLAGADSEGLAFQVRDEQRQGKISGARLLTSGRGIGAKGASGDLDDLPLQVSGEADARKAVGELRDRKVDALVLWASGMKPEAWRAVIDEAHKANLKVFADAPELASAKDLAKSGVDALIGSVRDREVDAEFTSLLKEKNIPLAPALSSLEARFVYTEDPKWLGEQAMREAYPAGLSAYLDDPVVVNRMKRDPKMASYKQQYSTAAANLKKLSESGVKIAFGSASGSSDTFPGYFEHRELELMVSAGMTPADAIKSTSVSAAALGLKELGTLAAGQSADFMVLSNNPLEKITASKAIDSVYIKGHPVDRLAMIQNIKVEVPRITEKQRAQEAETQRQEAELAAEAKLPHYGQFVLGPSVSIKADGLSIPTPKRSKATLTEGPPHRIVVSLSASGNALREFYAKALPPRWSAAGSCFERPHPLLDGKKARLCPEPSANQIVLTITVQ